MANMNELGLGNEQVGDADASFDTMPDQMGTFAPPPQPGSYRFKLPTNMGDLWEKAEKSGKNAGPRIKAKFDDAHPLVIVQATDTNLVNEPFTTTISNVERKRGKDDDAPEVSDMDYLLRDGFGIEKKPKQNKEYITQMIALAGKEFGADIEWSWRCNPERKIYVEKEGGGYEEMDQMGCGARYYQKNVDKVNGEFPERITCLCGANVRGFANLTRFRK